MFCYHKWQKWSDPRNAVMGNGGGIGWLSVCQIRLCEKCGKAQYRKLPEVRSIDGIKDLASKEDWRKEMRK